MLNVTSAEVSADGCGTYAQVCQPKKPKIDGFFTNCPPTYFTHLHSITWTILLLLSPTRTSKWDVVVAHSSFLVCSLLGTFSTMKSDAKFFYLYMYENYKVTEASTDHVFFFSCRYVLSLREVLKTL